MVAERGEPSDLLRRVGLRCAKSAAGELGQLADDAGWRRGVTGTARRCRGWFRFHLQVAEHEHQMLELLVGHLDNRLPAAEPRDANSVFAADEISGRPDGGSCGFTCRAAKRGERDGLANLAGGSDRTALLDHDFFPSGNELGGQVRRLLLEAQAAEREVAIPID